MNQIIKLYSRHTSALCFGFLCAFACLLLPQVVVAESVPSELIGDWSLELSTKEPAWLKVEEKDGKPVVYMRVLVLRPGPHKGVELKDGRLTFPLSIKREAREVGPVTPKNVVSVGMKDGKLDGVISNDSLEKPFGKITFTGKKFPPMSARPDLTKVRFGQPITLFNGKDLTGWRLYNPKKINGWRAENGVLINETPKTDFSSTGAYGNLQTEAVFDDFRLHIEFKIEANCNSGVYLRGMYEAQVSGPDLRTEGIRGAGAIYSIIAPTEYAGKEPGQWQTYDITLADLRYHLGRPTISPW
ncbi:MAG: 3-keto-disaccharide hydrolase [Pirellulales bacterium]